MRRGGNALMSRGIKSHQSLKTPNFIKTNVRKTHIHQRQSTLSLTKRSLLSPLSTRPETMRPKSENPALQTSSSSAAGDSSSTSSAAASLDPIFHILRILPFSFLRPPRLRLKLPSFSLPSANLVFAFVLLTYFMVVSGIVYDIIVEPPGIGSTQDPYTGSVRPVVFMSGRVNGQYIIEGLSSGFMFVLGGIGIVLLDLALDRNRPRTVKSSYAAAGVSSVVLAYVMSMLFIRIKIPAYLR